MAFMKAAGKWGGILVLIALLITLVKNVIAFLGFLTFAIKAFIVILFIAIILGVGFLVLKGLSERRRKGE